MNHPAHPCLAAIALTLALAASAAASTPAASAAASSAATSNNSMVGENGDIGERVRQLISASVPMPALQGGAPRVEIDIGQLNPRLKLAPCQRIEPQLPANGLLWGRTHIGLRCVEGSSRWLVWLPVVVKVYAQALSPVKPLPAGTVLMAEHLQRNEVDWAASKQEPFTQASELVGRSLSRAVQAGQALREGDVRLRQWFAAGDTVRVRARGNGFVVGGHAQAMGAGIEGRSVRVRTESGRVLTGMPVAVNQVEVTL